jgi:hypothetical protein
VTLDRTSTPASIERLKSSNTTPVKVKKRKKRRCPRSRPMVMIAWLFPVDSLCFSTYLVACASEYKHKIGQGLIDENDS